MSTHDPSDAPEPAAWSFASAVPDPAVDEPINRWVHRRLAFALLVMTRPVSRHLSPNLVTVLAGVFGLAAGGLLIWATTDAPPAPRATMAAAAAGCLLAAVIFDCADGMLARLTGRSSPFGMVLDGAMDAVVSASAWVGIAAYLSALTGNPALIWPLCAVVAMFTFLQIASYDQLKQRYVAALSGRILDHVTVNPPSFPLVRPFWHVYATIYPFSVRAMLGPKLERPPADGPALQAVHEAMRLGRWMGLGLRLALLYTGIAVLAVAPNATLPWILGGIALSLVPQLRARRAWTAAASLLRETSVTSAAEPDLTPDASNAP